MEKTVTPRGFNKITFKDYYDESCYIQKSSLANKDAIWLGVEDAHPQIMAVHAEKLGIETDKTAGWIPYPIPKEVLLTTQMHLTVEQVKELIPILQKFVETGDIA